MVPHCGSPLPRHGTRVQSAKPAAVCPLLPTPWNDPEPPPSGNVRYTQIIKFFMGIFPFTKTGTRYWRGNPRFLRWLWKITFFLWLNQLLCHGFNSCVSLPEGLHINGLVFSGEITGNPPNFEEKLWFSVDFALSQAIDHTNRYSPTLFQHCYCSFT